MLNKISLKHLRKILFFFFSSVWPLILRSNHHKEHHPPVHGCMLRFFPFTIISVKGKELSLKSLFTLALVDLYLLKGMLSFTVKCE